MLWSRCAHKVSPTSAASIKRRASTHLNWVCRSLMWEMRMSPGLPCYLLRDAYHWPLTAHYNYRPHTAHNIPHTTHLDMAHHSLLTTHHSPLTNHRVPLTALHSLPTTHHLPLNSLLIARFTTSHSLFTTHHVSRTADRLSWKVHTMRYKTR